MTIRWGLLGTARINRLLIPAIRASGRCIVAAVGSRDATRAAAYARQWDIPHSHGSYEALLDSPIDIGYDSLPASLHVPWSDVEDAVLGLHPPRLSLQESRWHAATLAVLHSSAQHVQDVTLT